MIAPTLADINRLAHQTIDDLPMEFRTHAQAIALRVEDFATQDILSDLGIESPFELTGLYDGIPLTEKSFAEQATKPDMIWLYRRPILDEWIERDIPLAKLVRHVVVHELAHHFGWTDEDIATIDKWWE